MINIDENTALLIQTNPIEGIVEVLNSYDIAYQEICDNTDPDEGWTTNHYDLLLEIYAFFSGLHEEDIYYLPDLNIDFTGHIYDDCITLNNRIQNIKKYFNKKYQEQKFEILKYKFKKVLGNNYLYQFTDADLETIQSLINQLRNLFHESDDFEPNHKQRLLERLEKLQVEMNKKMSNLDSFWAFVGDAGTVLGKFGGDVKPFVDRIKELAEIFQLKQSKPEALPNNSEQGLLGNLPE